jgi:hypothetical protein
MPGLDNRLGDLFSSVYLGQRIQLDHRCARFGAGRHGLARVPRAVRFAVVLVGPRFYNAVQLL